MTDSLPQSPKIKVNDEMSKCRRRYFLGLLVGAFTCLNILVFGRRKGWWGLYSSSKERNLHLSLAGPFEDSKPVYFGLEAPPADFPIWPFHARVTESGTGEVFVRYEYRDKAARNKSTSMKLKILLKDSEGNVYRTIEKDCPVAIAEADYKKKYPRSRYMILPENGVRFDVPLQELERLQAIDFDFSAIQKIL